MPDSIYARPDDYDLEHEGDTEDIGYYRRLVRRLRPARIVELGCGSGRITVPLAREVAAYGGAIVGLDASADMLAEAQAKLAAAERRGSCLLCRAAFDALPVAGEVDLVIVPCGTLSHVLELDEQLALWRAVAERLRPGGRFIADVVMPDLRTFADSLQVPPRVLLELDIDHERGDNRLIRYKTTRYEPDRQRATVRFLYDRFEHGSHGDRYVSDFESHVYYPRELQLLFRATGFEVEAIHGDHQEGPLTRTSRALLVVGRKPERG